jgi:hypothetical protein
MLVTVGFSRGNTWLSKVICFMTKSNISHTYFRFHSEIPNMPDIIVQASGLMVNCVNEEVFESHSTIIEELDFIFEERQYDDLLRFIAVRLGKPYSVKHLLGMTWVLINRYFGKRIKNPFADGDHSYVCVELSAKGLNIPNAEELTPQDLLDILRNRSLSLIE